MDLPPALHRRVTELSRRTGRSLSATLADLTARGLSQLNEPVVIGTDENTGMPVVSVGRRVTAHDVAAALDDD